MLDGTDPKAMSLESQELLDVDASVTDGPHPALRARGKTHNTQL